MAKKTKYKISFETKDEANAFIRGLEFRTIHEKVKSAYYEDDGGDRNFLPFSVYFELERIKNVSRQHYCKTE